MHRTLTALAAAALLTCAGVTAASANGLSGVLTLNVGVAALDSDDSQFDEDSYFTFGGDARVSNTNWIVEGFATSISDTDANSSGDEGSVSFGVAGHYLQQRSEQFIWGVFLGVQNTTFQDANDTAYHVFGGVEGARHWDRTTAYGQLGYSHAFAGDADDTWESGPFVRVGVRHFPREDRKIELDVATGYGEYDADGAADEVNHYSWGLEYEQQLRDGPLSMVVSYRGYYTEDDDTGNDATDHVFGLALRVSLGDAGSVQHRHTHGADRFRSPDFHRAYSYPDNL